MARPAVTQKALAAARGDGPADLLITGGQVFSPATREWISTDLAICDGQVVGWGSRDAIATMDVEGAALCSGFVDAHMHLESSKVWVSEFVKAVLPHGTTAVACDPHEVANVAGLPGVISVIEAAADMPFTFGIAASSCVPASKFESASAPFTAHEVKVLLNKYGAIGVAEVMNFPGVINGEPMFREIIDAAGWRRVDGHAPGLRGNQLDAYLAAGVESDHECIALDEALEKRQKGMWVFLRHGSLCQELVTLLPTVLNQGSMCCAFSTDDREPDMMRDLGHVNHCARLATEHGLSDIDALLMASFFPAMYHNFFHLGSLGPGYQADVLVFDKLTGFRPVRVLQAGRVVAEHGKIIEGVVPQVVAPRHLYNTIRLHHSPVASDFILDHDSVSTARVIGITDGTIRTQDLILNVQDQSVDIARIAVVERHHATGRIGLGYVAGYGIKRGAIASSVAHDAHNVMVVGARDKSGPHDMAVAVARVAELGGGQVVVVDGKIIAEAPLPIAGLMSDLPLDQVVSQLDEVVHAAHGLGISLSAPFMTLSFLGLSVIPSLRITDHGLIDVNAFAKVPVGVN